MPGPYELGYDGYQMQLDYVARADSQPVFLGYAAPGVPTSQKNFIIYKFTYDASNRPTQRLVAMNVDWDSRATLTYS